MKDSDLEMYIYNFFGFGNWKSKIWFIGIEEGGGNTKEEVSSRLNSWLKYKTDLIDNNIHHKNIGIYDFFDRGKLQPTWKKLIRLKLAYEGKKAENNLIRNIQKNNWGRFNSDNALLDLFPLPSTTNSNWFYNEWSKLPYLDTRKNYYNNVVDARVEYIQNKLKKHKPEIVIFYSISMIDYWNRIVEDNFKDNSTKIMIDKNYIKIIKKNDTKFVVTPQPAAVYSNEFWDKAGKFIHN